MTPKLKRTIIILLAVLLLLLLLLLLYRYIQRAIIKRKSNDTPDGVFPLSFGSGSEAGPAREYVKVLQRFYNKFCVTTENGRTLLVVDGNWGQATEDAMNYLASQSAGRVGTDGRGATVSEQQYNNMLSILNQQQ